MVSGRGKDVRVKPCKVTSIEREEASRLSRRVGELLAVDAPIAMGLHGRNDIETTPAKTDGHGVKDVLVQIKTRATHLRSRSRAPEGGSAWSIRMASISSR